MVRLPAAADIISRLQLQPHPEGGHYRESFRDLRTDANGRSLSTAIFFCWRAANARTGIASTRWRSGTIMQAPR